LLNNYFFKYFCKYQRVPVDTRGYEKIDGYPHNGYPTDMGMGTGRIFIQQVGYEGTTTRTLPALLTFLYPTYKKVKCLIIPWSILNILRTNFNNFYRWRHVLRNTNSNMVSSPKSIWREKLFPPIIEIELSCISSSPSNSLHLIVQVNIIHSLLTKM